MSDGEVIGHTWVPCSTCAHPNDPQAEWCDACLAEVALERRRRRPRRLSTRALARPRRDEVRT